MEPTVETTTQRFKQLNIADNALSPITSNVNQPAESSTPSAQGQAPRKFDSRTDDTATSCCSEHNPHRDEEEIAMLIKEDHSRDITEGTRNLALENRPPHPKIHWVVDTNPGETAWPPHIRVRGECSWSLHVQDRNSVARRKAEDEARERRARKARYRQRERALRDLKPLVNSRVESSATETQTTRTIDNR